MPSSGRWMVLFAGEFRRLRAAQVCRPYGVGRRESQSWREAQGPPLRFQFPQRRSEASHKVLLRRVSCFAAKRGLIARERPRPASLGLRPIHLQKTLTVSLRAKCRRPAAVALRCALRGYLSLRNLIVPQRRSAASHKVLLRPVSCFAAKRGLIARERKP